MSSITAHRTKDDDEPERTIAMIHPASKKSVDFVLAADENSIDGRTQFVWVRLPNGDLILGVFPQGETYMAVEDDAVYPD